MAAVSIGKCWEKGSEALAKLDSLFCRGVEVKKQQAREDLDAGNASEQEKLGKAFHGHRAKHIAVTVEVALHHGQNGRGRCRRRRLHAIVASHRKGLKTKDGKQIKERLESSLLDPLLVNLRWKQTALQGTKAMPWVSSTVHVTRAPGYRSICPLNIPDLTWTA